MIVDVAVVEHADLDALRAHVADLWRDASDATWASPTRSERADVARGAALLAAALDTCDVDALGVAGRALGGGWGLTLHRAGDVRVVLAHELRPHGGPLLAWRCGAAVELVVQAPHSHYDLGTGALALDVLVRADVRGVMWSTVHRYGALPGERPEATIHPADVCAQPGSTFQAWSMAVAATRPVRVVQLHGFGRGEADVILSSGDPDAPPEGAARVTEALVGPTSVFGVDTSELGATGNALGRALAPGRFLHVELSPGARERLRGEAVAALVDALGEVVW